MTRGWTKSAVVLEGFTNNRENRVDGRQRRTSNPTQCWEPRKLADNTHMDACLAVATISAMCKLYWTAVPRKPIWTLAKCSLDWSSLRALQQGETNVITVPYQSHQFTAGSRSPSHPLCNHLCAFMLQLGLHDKPSYQVTFVSEEGSLNFWCNCPTRRYLDACWSAILMTHTAVPASANRAEWLSLSEKGSALFSHDADYALEMSDCVQSRY